MPLRTCCLAIPLLALWVVAAPPAAKVDGKNVRIEFDQLMHSRMIAKFDGKEIALGDFAASEFITVNGKPIQDFTLGEQMFESMGVQRVRLIGTGPSLKKTVIVETNEFGSPRMATPTTKTARFSARSAAPRHR